MLFLHDVANLITYSYKYNIFSTYKQADGGKLTAESNKMEEPKFFDIAKELLKKARIYAEVTGTNHFKESFDKGGFTDVSFSPWAKIKNPASPVRPVLLNTSYLRDSVQVFSSNNKEIVFGSDAEYAQIHNEGGTIKITNSKRAKKYFWFMYYQTKNEMWKNMALSKKSHFTITIPKRQFIGESKTLLHDLDDFIKDEIVKAFN